MYTHTHIHIYREYRVIYSHLEAVLRMPWQATRCHKLSLFWQFS